MKQWLTTILVVLVVVAGGFWGYQYMVDKQTYISTDNATLEADTYTLTANQTGVLSNWSIKDGDTVTDGNTIGQVDGNLKQLITAPITGTVLKTSVFPKQLVLQGQALAKIANMNQVYVLAFIDEDQVKQVKTGKDVKITIKSLSNNSYDGKVMQIGSGTGDVYESSSLPSKQQTKTVVKRVPVKISISDLPFDHLVLGVHAEVKIEK